MMIGRSMLAAIALGSAALGSDCPVTTPPNPPFVAPAPHQPIPDAPGFWYGTAGLWTVLVKSGAWGALPHTARGYSQKAFFWSKDFNWRKEMRPDLRIAGKRLDGEAPAFTGENATHAIFGDTAAMLTGINIPTTGCWEITTRYRDHELKYVVKVEDDR